MPETWQLPVTTCSLRQEAQCEHGLKDANSTYHIMLFGQVRRTLRQRPYPLDLCSMTLSQDDKTLAGSIQQLDRRHRPIKFSAASWAQALLPSRHQQSRKYSMACTATFWNNSSPTSIFKQSSSKAPSSLQSSSKGARGYSCGGTEIQQISFCSVLDQSALTAAK